MIAHPGSLSVNDFKNVEIPLSMILAQEDFTFDSIKAGVLKVLDEKKANGGVAEYTNYPGTTHGTFFLFVSFELVSIEPNAF